MFKQELYQFNGNSARPKTEFLWRFSRYNENQQTYTPMLPLHRLNMAVMRLFFGEPLLISTGKSMPMDAKSPAHTARPATAL